MPVYGARVAVRRFHFPDGWFPAGWEVTMWRVALGRLAMALLLCSVLSAEAPPALAGGGQSPPAVSGLPPAFLPGTPVPDVPEFPPMSLDARLAACLPARLHPVSRQFLELWLAGSIGTRTFRRFFHMPNSDYLPVGECLVRVRRAILAESRRFSSI
jgi:hypothetical protein